LQTVQHSGGREIEVAESQDEVLKYGRIEEASSIYLSKLKEAET